MTVHQEKPRPRGRLMTQKDVAEEFGLTTRDVLRYVQSGHFPAPVRVTGRKRWFRREDVNRWAAPRAEV